MPSASDGAGGITSAGTAGSDLLSGLRQRLEARRAVLAASNAASSRAAGQQQEQQVTEVEEEDEFAGTIQASNCLCTAEQCVA